jgi:hypothetical protein
MSGIQVKTLAQHDVLGNTLKGSVREILAEAKSNQAIAEFESLQDSLHLTRGLPEAMGFRVAIRLRPIRNKVKFSQQAARVGWRERGALYGLIRPMRLVMEGYHSYGKKARRIKAKKAKGAKAVKVVQTKQATVAPKDNHRHYHARGWEIVLIRHSRGNFSVVREKGEEGEVQNFTKESDALQLYAQWITWAKHQPM